jgi:CubicO group peptidase (beta-lactamase class C family)
MVYSKSLSCKSKWAMLVLFVSVSLSCKEDDSPSLIVNNPAVDEFIQEARDQGMQSFTIYQKNTLEGAYNFDGNENTAYDLRSVTKSITTTLIGIAIDKGLIESENETIGQFLEPLMGPIDPVKANLRIVDLLTMTAGATDEFFNAAEYFRWMESPDHLGYIIDTSISGTPGTFSYNNGLMFLLGAIIQQSSGLSLKEFARINLFEPIGIKSRGWETIGNFQNGGAGIELTAVEMAKIGLLYLNGGSFEGKQIVSEAWISKALTPYVATIGYGEYSYGYGWWLGYANTTEYAYALGYGGQFIFIIPELDLVITATNALNTSEAEAIANTIQTRDFITTRVIKHYADSN